MFLYQIDYGIDRFSAVAIFSKKFVILLAPFSIGDLRALHLTIHGLLGVLYIGIIATVVCTLLWTICVEKVGATTARVFINLDAIFTALLAFVFLGESITWMQVVGCLIAISACSGFAYFEKQRSLRTTLQTA
uniref:DMT family transporter n=1 Tax=Kurthia senegalensis TaxID=1033740 RepID=UPI002E22CF96